MGLLSRKSIEQKFWDWFVKNEGELRLSKDVGSPLGNEMQSQLERVNPGLVWEMDRGDAGNNMLELIVSADGKRELFSTARALVDKAPSVAGWKITAFRQRRELRPGWALKMGNSSLIVGDIRYQLLTDVPGKIGIRLFIAGYRDDDEDIAGAMFMLLDASLGEYDMETKVGVVEMKPEDPTRPDQGQPFLELPRAFDAAVRR